jgi:hypothetical protein
MGALEIPFCRVVWFKCLKIDLQNFGPAIWRKIFVIRFVKAVSEGMSRHFVARFVIEVVARMSTPRGMPADLVGSDPPLWFVFPEI